MFSNYWLINGVLQSYLAFPYNLLPPIRLLLNTLGNEVRNPNISGVGLGAEYYQGGVENDHALLYPLQRWIHCAKYG